MSTEAPSIEGGHDAVHPPVPSEMSRPDLKRRLRDLLVQDELSDSDVEMLERNSIEKDQFDQGSESIDPEMCVECGDQVFPLRDDGH
jgi:hypothetical protein